MTTATRSNRERVVSLITLAAGLIQSLLAIGVLFLPIFATCIQQHNTLVCRRESYIQQGGNLVGYGFLFLMLGIGISAIISTKIQKSSQVCIFRWLAVLLTASFVVIGVWSIGLLFVPGGVLMLIAALSCRQS